MRNDEEEHIVDLQNNIIRRIGEAGGRLRVRSALNPALWLCVIVTVPLAVLYSRMSAPPMWLALLTAAPVVTAVLGFLFLLCFDRDKLQSEDYQIRKKSLELIQHKGQRFPILAVSIDAIANPQLKRMEEGREVNEDNDQ